MEAFVRLFAPILVGLAFGYGLQLGANEVLPSVSATSDGLVVFIVRALAMGFGILVFGGIGLWVTISSLRS